MAQTTEKAAKAPASRTRALARKAAKAPTGRPGVTSKKGTTSRRTVTRRRAAVDQTTDMSAEVLNAVEDGQRTADSVGGPRACRPRCGAS